MHETSRRGHLVQGKSDSKDKEIQIVKARLEGLMAAPFTPMNADGSVNLDMIDKQVESLQRNGVKGAFICGTTGESMSLTAAERQEVARRWMEVAPDDFEVMVHVGHTSIELCKSLAAHAQEIGARGMGAMGPFFYKPQSVEDLVGFCVEVAAAAPQLPFYYYHIPLMTGVNLPMVDFLKAAAGRIPNLAGIKFSWQDLMDFGLCRNLDGGRFEMLFGCDEMMLCARVLGARGFIGSTYNFAALLYIRLLEAFDAGDMETACRLQCNSMEMVDVIDRTVGSFLGAAKAVMKMVGVDCGPARQPLRNLTPQQHEGLRAELEKIGFLEYCAK